MFCGRFTRSGRGRVWGRSLPGVSGFLFLVLGYFVVVMFGVSAGQSVARGSCCCGSCSCRRLLWSRSWLWWLQLVVVMAGAVMVGGDARGGRRGCACVCGPLTACLLWVWVLAWVWAVGRSGGLLWLLVVGCVWRMSSGPVVVGVWPVSWWLPGVRWGWWCCRGSIWSIPPRTTPPRTTPPSPRTFGRGWWVLLPGGASWACLDGVDTPGASMG